MIVRKTTILKAAQVGLLGSITSLSGIGAALAESPFTSPRASLNLYGSVGLIDMPSGEQHPAGQISSTIAGYSGVNRSTLTFQIIPRLSGSFRYASIDGYNAKGRATRFDRSFDVRFQVIREGKYLPSVTVGLQDFAGTGVYSAEYIVATKNLHPTLKVTAGIGWGRLGGRKGFTQRNVNIGKGGVPDAGNWFRGPIAPFGGIEWQTPIEGLVFKAEYSSDAYVVENRQNIFNTKNDYNFGLEYSPNSALTFGAYYLHGSEFALKASLSFNPRRAPAPSGLESAPLSVFSRPNLRPGEQFAQDWVQRPGINGDLRKKIQKLLDGSELKLEALQVSGTAATLYLRNPTYIAQAEAIGRAARILSRTLPASVESFRIIPVNKGVPVSAITLQRRDLETLEYDAYGAEKLLQRAKLEDAPARRPEGLEYADGLYPKFTWSITPAVRTSFFDPDAPIRADVGIRARASYELAPGLTISGSVIKPLYGNLKKITKGGKGNPKIPRVRSLAAKYIEIGDPALERLTIDYIFKLRSDVYGRVSAGLFETMFGGISAEVLWKPAGSRFGLGAEINYVKQRDFKQRFGFRNYTTLTGHVSAYWDWDNGFTAQVDAGRYLAGDIGATFTLNRQFANGWKVGAFFTLTDMPFKDFGEGSFDKGITLTIPVAWGIGTPTRRTINTVIRPLTRDGGARVGVQNRLYPLVKSVDSRATSTTWGRVWR